MSALLGVDRISGNCQSSPMTASVDSFFDEYARRYTERDAEGVTNLCLCPFLAVRRGRAIHLPDHDAVRNDFASEMGTYRIATGTTKWTTVKIDVHQLGEHSVFATVYWNALDSDGNLVRENWTSYHLLATPDGWRILSYTSHF
jgi:hypothetical protein